MDGCSQERHMQIQSCVLLQAKFEVTGEGAKGMLKGSKWLMAYCKKASIFC